MKSYIEIKTKGSYDRVNAYLNQLSRREKFTILAKYGAMGVAALSNATPVGTGLTAALWTYEIVNRAGYYSIRWHNSHVVDGVPIAIILQYGHGTRNGGYVEGRDYIMPAIRPVFDRIVAEADRALRAVGR